MRLSIRAHFDGKVIVPDEPVNLPVNQALSVELTLPQTGQNSQERLAALDRLAARAVSAGLPLEATRRENLYEDR